MPEMLTLASRQPRLPSRAPRPAHPCRRRNLPAGDWESAWDIFEGVLPVEDGSFPSLESLLAWDPDAEQKERRREHEARIKVGCRCWGAQNA